jgi:hypothetical protein
MSEDKPYYVMIVQQEHARLHHRYGRLAVTTPAYRNLYAMAERLETALAAVTAELNELRGSLTQPDALRIEMLRGAIAEIDTLRADKARLLDALIGLNHEGGCYCDAQYAMHGAHPRHSPECEMARAAIDAAKGGGV